LRESLAPYPLLENPQAAPHRARMDSYELQVAEELKHWQAAMLAKPGIFNQAAQRVQRKINSYIPDKVHAALTTVIKQMIQGVLTGSQYTGLTPLREASLFERESQIRKRVGTYRHTAAAEGGITGAGGIMLGLADFPLLLTIKLKMLFDISALYGYAADDYRERLFILGVFQLAFSSDAHRRDVYLQLADWDARQRTLPATIDEYDWRRLQQEYRDYIDLAKLAQLLPIVGAPVGYIVNRRLIDKLGITAMNAYRMRWLPFAADDEVTR
jgi:hypothetical protein